MEALAILCAQFERVFGGQSSPQIEKLAAQSSCERRKVCAE